MDQYEVDAVIIGAGTAGLACGRALAHAGREVMVLEAANAIATETSSRNSEVIHAGLYYEPGSLKAEHCVKGRRLLYEYLSERNVTYWRCGKFVVAIGDEELGPMQSLFDRGHANDVEHISLIDASDARKIEPALSEKASAVLVSPESGIFDSHGYFLALQGEIEDHGGSVVFNTPVLSGRVVGEQVELEIGGEAPALVTANTVVNAAGHRAVDVAKAIEGPHQANLPKMWFVKGSYFTIHGKTPFSRLIYPMHTSASLGLHLTVDLNGRGKLGPDAEWLPEGTEPPFNYQVDPARSEVFYDTVRRYWPGLPDGALSPDYAGVRPKIVGPGEPSADFRIEGAETHGAVGLVNLFGIESPGLTSSLAIGELVAKRLSD